MYLETQRLALRRFTTDDVENLLSLDSDPEVMRYLSGGKPTPRRMIEQEVLPRFLRSYERGEGFGVFAANLKATGAFLGWFSFRPFEDGGDDEVSLGYRLCRSAWGNGYGTEGARALLRKGFTELGVQRVSATAYEENLASRRVMEKVGMKLARRYRMTSAELLAESTFDTTALQLWDGDDVEYALRRVDWVQLHLVEGKSDLEHSHAQ
jgi:RimJ/RimL family protein N-acetyltransferase